MINIKIIISEVNSAKVKPVVTTRCKYSLITL